MASELELIKACPKSSTFINWLHVLLVTLTILFQPLIFKATNAYHLIA